MFLQSDRLRDVVELFQADIIEAPALSGELLVDLDGLLGHHLVGLLGPADQREVRSGGDAFVAVGIQAHAEHDGVALSFSFDVRHEQTLRGKAVNSKGKFW